MLNTTKQILVDEKSFLIDKEKKTKKENLFYLAGGLRQGKAFINGIDVFKSLKYECGVHRVQRVPLTEKSGRIHTSTATVAVLPQPKDVRRRKRKKCTLLFCSFAISVD